MVFGWDLALVDSGVTVTCRRLCVHVGDVKVQMERSNAAGDDEEGRSGDPSHLALQEAHSRIREALQMLPW